MQVRLLGPVSVHHGDAELDLGGLKQRAVLALLALDANRVVALDRLVDEVWQDEPPARAVVALRAYVSRLRRVLDGTGMTLRTRAPGWSLEVPADQVDALRFVRLLADARRELAADRPAPACVRLREALALWAGEPLADLTALDYARAEAVRLHELRQEADELLLEARLAVGDEAGLVDRARSLAEAHPYRERVWCALVLALYRDGQQSAALEACGRLRQILRDELGLEPSPRVRELEVRILRHDPGLTRGDAAADEARTRPDAHAAAEPLWLVGRTEALAALDAALRAAAGGRGRLLLVEAAEGAGKTALLRALEAAARAAGGRVLEGHGVGEETTPALWPWVGIVRQLLAQVPDLASAGSATATAALAATVLGGGVGGGPVEDARLTQTTLYRGVVDLLLAARRTRPLVVVVDDLQWVDPDSLTLLALAVDQLVPAGVLFAVALRREAPGGTRVARLVGTLGRDAVTRVALPALGGPEVAALCRRVAGHDVADELVSALTARTSGNPLFVTELVRLLVAEDQLTALAASEVLPAGVREVLQRRVDALPAATGRLLVVAALTAPGVLDLDLLADVTGLSEDEVLDGCEAGLRSGLLVEHDDPRGAFGLSHDLVRQTLVAGVSGPRRVRLHARIAAALRRRPGSSPEQVVEIARQLTLAAPAVGAAAAVPFLVSASEDALSRSAHESAEATLETALALAGTIADPGLRLATVSEVTGLLDGLRTLVRAAPRARVAGDDPSVDLPRPTDARSAAGWLGTVITVTTSGRWAWGAAAARALLAGSPTRSAEIAARLVLGWMSYVQGDLARASAELAVLDTMVEDGTDISLPGALSRVEETVSGYSALIAHAQGREATASERLDVARRRAQGSDVALLNVVLYECLLAAMRGDPAAAARHCASSEALSRRVAYPIYAVVTGVVAAWSRGLTGEPGESVDEAYARYAATGIRTYAVTYLLLRAEVRLVQGDHAGAAALVHESRSLAADLGEVCGSPRLLALAERVLAGPPPDVSEEIPG